ncbi:auxin-responsive protein SAUR32-like [Typha latifolia]|uniref:auxin-responsive protein SAUR32-like n=1 Tax=Typha latifolia TaxID=4733 RepID=UPI003C2AE3BE
MGVHLHLPHLGHGRKEVMGGTPRGCMAIRVGSEGEEQRRFVVPVMYLNHPLFVDLLKEAEEEYGFYHQGAITIPCHVDHFRHVQATIDRESCSSAAAAAAAAAGGEHHSHGGCFRAMSRREEKGEWEGGIKC